jgi:hypothetical protein
LINHAAASPKEIIINGSNFITDGSIKIEFVKNVIHLTALPARMDNIPNNIVGKITFICSLILIKEFARLGPHRTTNLNRVE